MKLKTLLAASLLAMVSKSASSECTLPTVYCSNTDFSNSFINSTTPGTIEYDNIVSTFHSTMARQSNGSILVWGELMAGTASFAPAGISVPYVLNSSNFPGLTGTVLKATGGGVDKGEAGFVTLTTDGLFAWGNLLYIVGTTTPSSSGSIMTKLTIDGEADGLPAGVNPGDVKMLFGTSRTLAIVTCSGAAYTLHDGTSWKQVETGASTPLTGVVAVRGANLYDPNLTAFMALKADGTIWTWGNGTLLGDGSAVSDRVYATQMTIPSGITPKMIGMVAGRRKNALNVYENEFTYYLLGINGDLYAMGGNTQKQLGDYNTTNTTSWVRPLKSNSPTDYLTDVAWISPQEHQGSGYMPAINVLQKDGSLWSWGYNSANMLGTGSDGAIDPVKNIGGLTAADKMMAVETGGHTTIVIKQCSGKFGYLGHYINGSMASGDLSNGPSPLTFNFTDTKTLNICGATSGAAFISPLSSTVVQNGDQIQLSYTPLGGTFSIVSGAATVSSTGLVMLLGSGANTVVVKYTSNSPCLNTEDQITINVQPSLSALFGAVNAKMQNNNLFIDWTTLNESNNNRFEIEASTDGENFTKIGEVISKAKDGNSAEVLQYSFNTTANNLKAFGIGLMVIGVLGMGLGLGSKRKKMILSCIMLVGAATFYTGCTKNDTEASKEGDLFIRIVQVDKDGARSISKIVKVQK